MSSLLYSLGTWSARMRGWLVVLWIALIAVVGGAGLTIGHGLDREISIPGTESQDALNVLRDNFPEIAGASAQIVVAGDDGQLVTDESVVNLVNKAAADIYGLEQVVAVVSPFDPDLPGVVSPDQQAAIVAIQFNDSALNVTDQSKADLEAIADSLRADLPDGYTLLLGGELFNIELPALTAMEVVGLVVALIVLVLTLGSFVAAGMPIAVAVVGVAVSMGFIYLGTAFTSINTTTPMLALMLGIAVGIDYSLFVISRHREFLAHGLAVRESIARAVGTAGSAVVFAGLTVIVALLGLSVAQIPFLTAMGVSAAIGIAIAVIASLTLLPALLSMAGERLRPKSRNAKDEADATGAEVLEIAADETADEATPVALAHEDNPLASGKAARFYARWVDAATRFPVVTIVAIVAAIGLVALPALNLRLALPDASSLPEGNEARQTYELVAEEFGPGFNSSIIATAPLPEGADVEQLIGGLVQSIQQIDGVAGIAMATPNQALDTVIVQIIPAGGPTDEVTTDLVHNIRDKNSEFQETLGLDVSVTGQTALGIDVSERLGGALLPFALLVVGLSLVLLLMVFRSIWVPIKATLGYLLSVGAAFGAVALVFNDGFLNGVLHISKTGPVISFMPIIVMGILFGLAMDYELFLVSRIREEHVHGKSAKEAIRAGFIGSGRVVTAAALIMFAVFLFFVPEGDMSIKPIALALAVGVFVDAFIVRMMLVPAVLALLGERAWWIPKWLDRILPQLDVEGEALVKRLENVK